MHPNAFLTTFWRMEIKPQIFVAMSFDPKYKPRFDSIIEPAIKGIRVNGVEVSAHRTDISKSGDSILTEIMEGIAHSQMVLADVSSIGRDSVTGRPYRNANVMYEVGIALACRQPQDVLLIRDDNDSFLFDVSTIPHLQIDFTDGTAARTKLQNELISRLREQQLVRDARVVIARTGLSAVEMRLLKSMPPGQVWGRPETGVIDFEAMAGIPRLLDKGLIELAGRFSEGHPAYRLSRMGRVVAAQLDSQLHVFVADAPKAEGEANDLQAHED